MIERALGAGIKPFSLLIEECWREQSEPLIERVLADDARTAVFIASRAQMRELTGLERTRGAPRRVPTARSAPRGRSARTCGARRRSRERDEPHQHRRDLPLRGGSRHRRGAHHPVVPRPLLPPRGARVDGNRVPGAVDAHRKRSRLTAEGMPLLRAHGFTHLRARPFRQFHPPAGRAPERMRAARARAGHRRRRPGNANHRGVRLHRAHSDGARRGLAQRGRRERRGVLGASGATLTRPGDEG